MSRPAAALALWLAAGCSVVFVKGPPDPLEPSEEPDCTDSKVLPVLDTIGGAVLGIAAIAAFSGAGSFSFNPDPEKNAEEHRPWAIGLTVGSLALFSSALVGMSRSTRCDEAHELHEASKTYSLTSR